MRFYTDMDTSYRDSLQNVAFSAGYYCLLLSVKEIRHAVYQRGIFFCLLYKDVMSVLHLLQSMRGEQFFVFQNLSWGILLMKLADLASCWAAAIS